MKIMRHIRTKEVLSNFRNESRTDTCYEISILAVVSAGADFLDALIVASVLVYCTQYRAIHVSEIDQYGSVT